MEHTLKGSSVALGAARDSVKESSEHNSPLLGPLHVGGYLDKGAPTPITFGTLDDPGDVIADVFEPKYAALFAAAPELLGALEKIMGESTPRSFDSPDLTAEVIRLENIKRLAQAAIKATQ